MWGLSPGTNRPKCLSRAVEQPSWITVSDLVVFHLGDGVFSRPETVSLSVIDSAGVVVAGYTGEAAFSKQPSNSNA